MAKIHFNDNDSVENFEIEKEKPHKCLNDIKFESTTESNQVELLKSVERFPQIFSHSQTQTLLHRLVRVAAAVFHFSVSVCSIQMDLRQITEYVRQKLLLK